MQRSPSLLAIAIIIRKGGELLSLGKLHCNCYSGNSITQKLHFFPFGQEVKVGKLGPFVRELNNASGLVNIPSPSLNQLLRRWETGGWWDWGRGSFQRWRRTQDQERTEPADTSHYWHGRYPLRKHTLQNTVSLSHTRKWDAWTGMHDEIMWLGSFCWHR